MYVSMSACMSVSYVCMCVMYVCTLCYDTLCNVCVHVRMVRTHVVMCVCRDAM